MTDFGLKKEELKMIKELIRAFPSVKESLIFGSRAMGHFKPASDIDIALKGDIDWDTLAKIKYQLEEDIPLPYFFDVVDYHSIHAPELKKHIDRYGRLFYKASS